MNNVIVKLRILQQIQLSMLMSKSPKTASITYEKGRYNVIWVQFGSKKLIADSTMREDVLFMILEDYQSQEV